LCFDKTIENWKNIKESLKKIIDSKYAVKNDDTIRKQLKQYSYTKSIILSCELNNIPVTKNNYRKIIYDIYVILGSVDKIMKYKTISVIEGNKSDLGYEYYPNLKISYRNYDAFGSLYEIVSQCKLNKIKLNMCIRLYDEKIYTIDIINGQCNIIVDDIVSIKNIEYLKNNNDIYKFETKTNKRGELYARINPLTGNAKKIH
jgi:hypothetical protein